MKTQLYIVIFSLFVIAIINLDRNTTTAQDPTLILDAADMHVAQSLTATRTLIPTRTPIRTPRPTSTLNPTAAYLESITLRVYVETQRGRQHDWHALLPSTIRAASRESAELIVVIEESSERGSRSAEYLGCSRRVYERRSVYTASIYTADSNNTLLTGAQVFRGSFGRLPGSIRNCVAPSGSPPNFTEFYQWLNSVMTNIHRQLGVRPTTELTEVFTLPEYFSLRYPEGWLIQPDFDEAAVLLANTPSALEDLSIDSPGLERWLSGEAGIAIRYSPVDYFNEQNIHSLFSRRFVIDEGTTISHELGIIQRYTARGRYGQHNELALILNTPEGQIIIVLTTAPGELDTWEPTTLEILESITFP